MIRKPWHLVFLPTETTLHVDKLLAATEPMFKFITFDECDAVINGWSAPSANARILVSRNKREGGYLGWRQLRYVGEVVGHQRTGIGKYRPLSLRDWRRP